MSNMRVAPAGRMGDLPVTVDVAIIGSGIGGSTIAYSLAGSGASRAGDLPARCLSTGRDLARSAQPPL